MAKGKRRAVRKRSPLVRILLSGFLVVGLVVGVGAGWFVYKGNEVSSKVFSRGGGVGDLLVGAPLKQDRNGRINVLVFGTSQDDPAHSGGSGGQGMWLTDSIQLVSINARTKQAEMIAIPRDTWVTLPKPCVVGYQSKINAVFECAAAGDRDAPDYDPHFFSSLQKEVKQYKKRETAGAAALMKVVGQVTGLKPAYYVHVNYSVVRDSVNAVGGVKVNIVGSGHEGIFDTNLDYPCPQERKSCRRVYYPRDGVYELNGTQALNLARARGDGTSETNLYACMQFGLDRGEFDRAANQQKIMNALKVSAVSAGTLVNPVKLNKLMDALGNNIITNLTASEGRTAIELGKSMGEMKPISLVDPKRPVLTTARISEQSVVIPTAGQGNFGSVADYIKDQIRELERPQPDTPIASGSKAPSAGTSASPKPSAKPTYEPPYTCAGID
ncbi:MAG TPA: LCP family protein [Marmoricola sp.]|nr:LCP family protein [Marmoricola sp.]HNI70256.1 LCP family protein [Marmoricola sp.]